MVCECLCEDGASQLADCTPSCRTHDPFCPHAVGVFFTKHVKGYEVL